MEALKADGTSLVALETALSLIQKILLEDVLDKNKTTEMLQ